MRVDRRSGGTPDGQRRGIAGRVPVRIGDNAPEGGTIVAYHSRRRCVARSGRASDIRTVLLPLIGKRRCTGRPDIEGRRSTNTHRLIRGMGGDGGPHVWRPATIADNKSWTRPEDFNAMVKNIGRVERELIGARDQC